MLRGIAWTVEVVRRRSERNQVLLHPLDFVRVIEARNVGCLEKGAVVVADSEVKWEVLAQECSRWVEGGCQSFAQGAAVLSFSFSCLASGLPLLVSVVPLRTFAATLGCCHIL